MNNHDALIRQLARIGAEMRVQRLYGELHELKQAFPDLDLVGESAVEARANGAARPRKKMATVVAVRKRRPIPAARRKEIAAQMRAYWAKRRAEKASAEKPVHWTQTEAGKHKMAKVARMRHKRGDFGHRRAHAS